MADVTGAYKSSRARNAVELVGGLGTTDEQAIDGYKVWSASYEKDLQEVGYCGPKLTSKYLCEVIPLKSRATTKVLDIGAGTGLVAIELRKAGFAHIDALDPSVEMLNEARQRNLYERYIVEYITEDKLNIPEGSYDALTGSGIFMEGGHVKPSACREMVRLVRKGGHIVIATRKVLVEESPVYKDKLIPLMKEIENEGKWKKLTQNCIPNFYGDKEAIIWVYQVL